MLILLSILSRADDDIIARFVETGKALRVHCLSLNHRGLLGLLHFEVRGRGPTPLLQNSSTNSSNPPDVSKMNYF